MNMLAKKCKIQVSTLSATAIFRSEVLAIAKIEVALKEALEHANANIANILSKTNR